MAERPRPREGDRHAEELRDLVAAVRIARSRYRRIPRSRTRSHFAGLQRDDFPRGRTHVRGHLQYPAALKIGRSPEGTTLSLPLRLRGRTRRRAPSESATGARRWGTTSPRL